VGVRWRWVKLDVAYGHVFLPEREVNRSTQTAMDFSGSGEVGPVVGNGFYSASVDMLSLQLTVSLDRAEDPRAAPLPPPQPIYLVREEEPPPAQDASGEVEDGYEFAPDPVR